MVLCLNNFKVIRPKYEQKQEALLEWIVQAHSHIESHCVVFEKNLRESLQKIGLGENKIQKRGFQINDCNHLNWSEMDVYNIEASPEGYHLGERMACYNEAASEIFEKMYPEECSLPPHLIHVTCTGYVAPSPAQKLVSLRGKGTQTLVTHAYHMGCYGSIPAVRMAFGHHHATGESTDIVHTELCSLHMNPSMHSKEQLVIQSLFADGFIKYSLDEGDEGLAILAISEEIIEDSTGNMTWDCHNWGFQMSISREVPVRIRKALDGYLERLAKKSGRDLQELRKAHFAIHPGGPKIIEQIAEKLQLSDEQISHSRGVLFDCGNMSSATLPHVWDRIVNDDDVPRGSLVVSIAFGPGLSISGALLEKR